LPVDFETDHTKRFVQVKAHGVALLQEILDYSDAPAAQGGMPYSKLFDSRVSAYAAFDPRGMPLDTVMRCR